MPRLNEDGSLVFETLETVKRRIWDSAPTGDWDAEGESHEDAEAEDVEL